MFGYCWYLLVGFSTTADIFPVTGLPQVPSVLIPGASACGLWRYSGRSSSVHCFWRRVEKQCCHCHWSQQSHDGSMVLVYIYANIGGILMVNVTIYGIQTWILWEWIPREIEGHLFLGRQNPSDPPSFPSSHHAVPRRSRVNIAVPRPVVAVNCRCQDALPPTCRSQCVSNRMTHMNHRNRSKRGVVTAESLKWSTWVHVVHVEWHLLSERFGK